VGADLFDRLFMQGGIPDNAAFADLFLLQFKLGFDEADDLPLRLQHPEDGPEDQGQGDEGNIDDDEIDRLGKIAGLEMAQVESLLRDDARIAPELPRELICADIVGIDLRRTALEDAIGETSRRSARIEDDLARDVDGELIERLLELEPGKIALICPGLDKSPDRASPREEGADDRSPGESIGTCDKREFFHAVPYHPGFAPATRYQCMVRNCSQW
jgi:hypothetical protein